jgi:serine/threonine protein kinase
MYCPACHTPNPEGALSCSHCSGELSSPGPTLVLADHDSQPTLAAPESFKEWSQRRDPASAAASDVLPTGIDIGKRYRVLRVLGRGGMGTVYLVEDRQLHRQVALKLIRSEIAESEAVIERFKREIHLSSQVTHRNVLRVYDLGEAEGVSYLTMQYIEGDDLASVLKKEKRLPVARIVSIFRQICEGLGAAHEQGVIHRDLKPQNVMIDAGDRVYLTDFGLAKTAEQSGVTQTGAVIGTPYYMSPEQVKGEPAGPRSDIYALGVILYEMATGAVPFGGTSVYEVMIARLQKTPRPAREVEPGSAGLPSEDPRAMPRDGSQCPISLGQGDPGRPRLGHVPHERSIRDPRNAGRRRSSRAPSRSSRLLAAGGWCCAAAFRSPLPRSRANPSRS